YNRLTRADTPVPRDLMLVCGIVCPTSEHSQRMGPEAGFSHSETTGSALGLTWPAMSDGRWATQAGTAPRAWLGVSLIVVPGVRRGAPTRASSRPSKP